MPLSRPNTRANPIARRPVFMCRKKPKKIASNNKQRESRAKINPSPVHWDKCYYVLLTITILLKTYNVK
jgi:hypothetical protein